MKEINWIQVGLGFLSGGAFGAFIKQYFDSRRNRIQPIGHTIELKSFYNSGDNKLINSEVILKDEATEYKFSKLYTGTVELLNTGLSDYPEFNFGLTASDKIKFLQVNSNTSDRHHIADLTVKPSLQNQINSFDVTLKPFNRKDKYSFDILLTSDSAEISMTDIQISSSKPVKWVKLVSTTDAILEIANKTLLENIFSHVVRVIKI